MALHLHRDEGACQGHRGIFNGDLMRVDVCDAGPLVVLHELAHAWTHVRVNGTQEDAYVQAGEFGAWTSPETPWNERGMEHAADTIAWALQEQPIRMLVEDGPIAERNEFFRMLTGRDAPRLVTS